MPDALHRLAALLPPERLLTRPEHLAAYESDGLTAYRTSPLAVAIPAVAIALVVGVTVGMLAGFFGGVVDRVVVTLLDSVQAFPAVILALTLLALVGHSLRNETLVISVAFIPSYARVTRALVMAAKNNQWVDAERSLGARPLRIVVVHILPNIAASILSVATTNVLNRLNVPTRQVAGAWG